METFFQVFKLFAHIIPYLKYDIAKSDIFTGEEEFQPNQLENLMEMALIKNAPSFVKLLLENGVNMKSFLTHKRLTFLYNSLKIRYVAKKSPLFQLFTQKYFVEKDMPIITLAGMRDFLEDYLFEDFEPEFISDIDFDWNKTAKFLVKK